MAFTDEDLVGGIVEVDTDIDLQPFIDAAHYLITKVVTDTTYTDADKAIIETWLAAHFYAVRDPRSVRETAGAVSVTLQGKVAIGFSVTEYGQQAMRLDIFGGLAKLDQQTTSPLAAGVMQILFVGNYDPTEDNQEINL